MAWWQLWMTEDPDGDTLTYDLIGTDAASFDIVAVAAGGQVGGQLQTKAELDYETKTSYMVMVTVTDGKDAEDNVDPTVDDTIRVTITVTAENEAPEFPAETATREVPENTASDANIGLPVAAMDVDDGDTTLAYTLGNTADDDAFAIVPTTGQLQTRAALDYETKTDYEVTVTATDGDLSDTITVTINVTDVTAGDTAVANSAPAFNDGPSTTRSVAENTAVKANIGAPVAARDVDRGDTLTYGLRSGGDASSFDIDEDTGQLKISETLVDALFDFESVDPPKTYMVTVTVTDGRDPVNTVNPAVDDEITVTITVTDVNEAPEFAAATATRTVAENTVAGVDIGLPVAATDVDSGDTLTYTLSGPDAASFAIVDDADGGGQLQTLAALDFETKHDYEVTVTATDDGTGTLSDTITVIITLINDSQQR